ncbi:MAG: ABC transporter substrate-binding protein, partial [Thermodesulfobacteriota bacterium]
HDLRMGFHKVAKYYYGPGWHEPGSVLEVIFNKKAWEELPPELQAVLDVAAAESNLAILAEFEVENGRALAALQAEKRVQIRAFPDQVLAELKKLAAATLEEVAASDPVAAKVHDAFTKFRAGQRSWSVLSEGAYYGTIG